MHHPHAAVQRGAHNEQDAPGLNETKNMKKYEMLALAKSLPETDEEVQEFCKDLPNNPLPPELADPSRILNKIKLLELALESEQQRADALQDLAEVKRTLVANFGPGGRVAHLIEGDERALVMIVKVLDHYVKAAQQRT